MKFRKLWQIKSQRLSVTCVDPKQKSQPLFVLLLQMEACFSEIQIYGALGSD